LNPSQVGLSANYQHKCGILRAKLFLTPMRPSLGRSHMISVKLSIDAVTSKRVRKL
jgi:hypothetical protein